MKSIIALLALIAFCLAQTDNPCNVPNQFQTFLQQIVVDDTGSCAAATTEGIMYFDYPNQRLRIDQSATVQSFTYTLSVWLDYATGDAYYYDRDNSQCYHNYLSGYIDEPEIPVGSSYEGTYVIGGQAINTWLTPGIADIDALELISVTDGTCFPVTDVYINTTTGNLAFQQTFWNFLPDLPPFYWDLPADCQSIKKNIVLPTSLKLKLKAPFQKSK